MFASVLGLHKELAGDLVRLYACASVYDCSSCFPCSIWFRVYDTGIEPHAHPDMELHTSVFRRATVSHIYGPDEIYVSIT